MHLKGQDKYKQRKSVILFLACIFAIEIAYSQTTADSVNGFFNKNRFLVDIGFNVIPDGRIRTYEGNYSLYTKIHSVYSAGVGYKVSLKPHLFFTTGLNFSIIKSNFFGEISNSELNGTGIVRVEDAPPIIYYKGTYLKIAVPLLIGIKSNRTQAKALEFTFGPKVNYNGFSGEETIIMIVEDTSNQAIKIFDANFKSNNDFRPWMSFMFSIGRIFLLGNKNMLGLLCSVDIGTTKFISADYRITLPNKPITIGSYSVNGPIIGLSIQYIFTGYNKRVVKNIKR